MPDHESGEKSHFEKNGSDALFLYFLFTFQFFVSCFGCVMFYKKMTGTPEYKKEKKVTPVKLTIQFFLIILNVFWMTNTYRLIQIDIAMQGLQWEPWTPLGLEVPTNVYDGFNPPGLKKQYRHFARLYHPDKVSADIDPAEAKKKWEEIQRANDCLSDKNKFNNWL